MMVMTDGTRPSMVVTIVTGGGGPDPATAESGGSPVAMTVMTVMTEGVGPSMVVTMVMGG